MKELKPKGQASFCFCNVSDLWRLKEITCFLKRVGYGKKSSAENIINTETVADKEVVGAILFVFPLLLVRVLCIIRWESGEFHIIISIISTIRNFDLKERRIGCKERAAFLLCMMVLAAQGGATLIVDVI